MNGQFMKDKLQLILKDDLMKTESLYRKEKVIKQSSLSPLLLFILVLLSVSLNADNDIQPQDCIFSSVLGTRHDPSEITMGSGSESFLDNTTECTLNTSNVYSDNDDHGLACDGGMASATGNYQNSLDINYSYTLQSPNTDDEPGNSTSIEVDSSNQNLPDDNIKILRKIGITIASLGVQVATIWVSINLTKC